MEYCIFFILLENRIMKKKFCLGLLLLSTVMVVSAQKATVKAPPAPPAPPKVEVKHVPPPPPAPPDYKAFLQRNPEVKNVSWLKDGHSVRIYLKSGETETYSLASEEEAKKLQNKYGKLPVAPPPPPPPIVIEKKVKE